MKTLLLLRHAKSSWADQGLDDHDRPLNSRGLHDAPKLGQLIADNGLVPDTILTSTALRALTTARLVGKQSGFQGECQALDDLYLATPVAFSETLRRLPSSIATALIVAHNPGLEHFILLLTGAHETMPTAALAQIELPIDTWSELADDTQGTLANLWRPREL